MQQKKLTAIVVGGGIGGLATATALGRIGWDVTVMERQPELRSQGAGIYIWGNGMRVLRTLGADEHITRNAFFGSHFEQRNKDNKIITSAELPPDSTLAVLRSELHKALADAGKRAGVRFCTNSEVVAVNSHGGVLLSSDQRTRADLVVGADGIWSRVRQSLGLELFHEQMAEGALRTVIMRQPGDVAEEDYKKYIECWNGLHRFLITPCNDREIYLALTGPGDDERTSSTAVDKERWSELFPAWAHMINRIGEERVTWGRYSIIKSKTWSAGHAAILGDAAHAQVPNLGQGGGMAMQNGLALAHFLKDIKSTKDIPAALEAWEESERPIVDHCQKWARLYGEVAYLPDDVREQTFKNVALNPWVHGQTFKAANHSPTGAV